MEPNETANKYYKYDTEFYGEPLKDLVQKLHEYNCKENGWFFRKLNIGCYGFDNLAICIGHTFDSINSDSLVGEIADILHKSWIINYVYWRDNQPWLNDIVNYIKPFKPINDERRNICAITEYKDLPEDEKQKDLILASWFKLYLKK